MSEDHSSGSSRSWLERITLALTGEPQTQKQLVDVLDDARERGLLDDDAFGMIEGVMKVSELQVRDVMIPRPQMVVVEKEAEPQEFLGDLIESGHSRFPVIGDNRDEVLGILLAKDLLGWTVHNEGWGNFDIRDLLRKPAFVPESKPLDAMLKEFRQTRNHMAIVVDEYGGVSGLVTIEDVLELIVGEIEDEYDQEEEDQIIDTDEKTAEVEALTPIEDFNEHFKTEYSDEEVDTVGGLVMQALGHLPVKGEVVEINNFRFEVLAADNRRIEMLKVEKID
ncbi:HlyC/CorC family transporter [Pelagibaculum spongiae]|uniref:Magnesium and cobalt efflux protein CorC n=1 Tax=Pelagibaculum spongiae TaxID=2080658 RepID=A0A2V1H3H1_9GAMM|nr:transporter associated domain-containing protein [Pelagibaculum spongiae]PVZ70186.1 magnesium/cobalt efflux protein [Pelagibaculum spongiae]